MRVTKFTRSALAHRRDVRDRIRDGWEFVGEGGGKLWEFQRGYRWRHKITDVAIAADGQSLWIKSEEGGEPEGQCHRMLREGANPQDMRDLGFSQSAIDAAINAVIEQEGKP